MRRATHPVRELALADATRADLLEAFSQNLGDDPEVPHAYANGRVLADLRARLGLSQGAGLAEVPGPALQEAWAVLREDTRRRNAEKR